MYDEGDKKESTKMTFINKSPVLSNLIWKITLRNSVGQFKDILRPENLKLLDHFKKYRGMEGMS